MVDGFWGRIVRCDIWLYRQVVWHVHAREGDGETGRRLHRRYHDEHAARSAVDQLRQADGPEQWRNLTGIATRRPPDRSTDTG